MNLLLGRHLTDLVFIEDGNSSYEPDSNELINVAKLISSWDTKKVLLDQKIGYKFLPDPAMLSIIHRELTAPPVEVEKLWAMSQALEPRI